MGSSLLEVRLCTVCGRPIPVSSRADRRYCSTRCRVLAFRQRHGSGTIRPAVLDRMAETAGPLSEPALLRGIERAAADDWQAAAWVLSRRWPQRWAAPAGRVAREPDLLHDLEPEPGSGAA
jgi:hypothetical protein